MEHSSYPALPVSLMHITGLRNTGLHDLTDSFQQQQKQQIIENPLPRQSLEEWSWNKQDPFICSVVCALTRIEQKTVFTTLSFHEDKKHSSLG